MDNLLQSAAAWLSYKVIYIVYLGRIQLNVDREVLFIEVLSTIRRIFFHPAKFDNFKDEKISDFKTVSVSQSKNLLD